MIRSIVAAFITVCLCFAIMQIPGQPDYVPLPASTAAPPQWELLPLPASSCPGGVCPLPARQITTVTPVIRSAAPVIRSVVHWTYPGEIRSHLANDHGISAAGMSTAQAEELHDQLHNGTAGYATTTRTVTTASTATYAAYAPTYRRVGTPVRTSLRVAAAPVRLVGGLLRGIRNRVAARRCR